MGYMKELDIRVKSAIHRCHQALASDGLTADAVSLVGSAYIECKNTSDIDVLCLVKKLGHQVDIGGMFFDDWEYGGSLGEGELDQWGSWKRVFTDTGVVNLLVTTDEHLFNGWVSAAEVCKFLGACGVPITRAVKCGIHDILMGDLSVDEAMQKQNPIVPL